MKRLALLLIIFNVVKGSDSSMKEIPRIGVGVLIFNNGAILLGKRKNSHGEASWAPPGGHLEFGETVEACAEREVTEETGLELTQIKTGPYTQDIFRAEHKHYISCFVIARLKNPNQIPEIKEPDRVESWQWWPITDLPENLFLPLKNLVDSQSLAAYTKS